MTRWIALALLFGAAGLARGEPTPAAVLERFSGEPRVEVLQRAAAREAELQPEHVRSWLARVRKAALLPSLRVQVGRGVGGLEVTHGLDGVDRFSTVDTDAWRFDVQATWTLDRLVFDPSELRLSREAQRVATRREQLSAEVARLYFVRRRLQVDTLLDPGAGREVALDRALAIDEVTAILDGLTGGRLSGQRGPQQR